jgi:tryptophan halogenase
MQAQLLAETLVESNRRTLPSHVRLYNDRVARHTDSIRRFLAIHYKFNTRLDTPFWVACREKVDLAGAEAVVEYFRESGPGVYWGHSLLDIFDFAGMTGYVQLLVGQKVAHTAEVSPTRAEQQILSDLFAKNRSLGMNGLSVKEMLMLARDPRVSWN